MARYLYLVAALIVPSLVMVAALPTSGQIIGGEPAKQGEFPYLVSLQQRLDGEHFCGGSLVNEDTVVTAAHCINTDPHAIRQIQIRAGSLSHSTGGILANVSSGFAHPSFSDYVLGNADLGVLKLATPIIDETIEYAKLAAAGSDPAAGEQVAVAGWGRTSITGTPAPPDKLRRVTVSIVERAICWEQYAGTMFNITDNTVCAGVLEGGKDACVGDSGGPLVNTAGEVVGIVSAGKECGVKGYPGLYAGIGAGRAFIDQHVR